MRSYSSSHLLVAVLAASTTLSAAAFAEEPSQQKSQPAAISPDSLSGHLIVAPRVGLLKPMGSYESGFSQSDYNGTGPAFGADISLGISRYVAVHGYVETAVLASNGGSCPSGADCKARTTSFGLGLEYHLVNGASFDPWMRWGVGYRITNLDYSWSGYSEKLDYKGMDWLHLAVGGDFYASRKLGFGPYLSFDFGYYNSRPDSVRPHAQVVEGEFHSFFGVGVRGVFDPMR